MSFSSNLVKSIPSLRMLFSRLCSESSLLGKKVSLFVEVNDGSKYRINGIEGETLRDVLSRYPEVVGSYFGQCHGEYGCRTCHVKFSKEFFKKNMSTPKDEQDIFDSMDSAENDSFCRSRNMATQRNLYFWFLLLIVAALSSFVIISAEESSKSEEQTDTTTSEDSNSQDDSKEKRSQEEIAFGNQQNKPNGLVDDLMSMSDSMEDTSNGSQIPDLKSDGTEEEKQISGQDMIIKDQNDVTLDGSNSDNWYSTLPASSSALQYLASAQALKSLPTEELSNSLYDQEDLYRRKRHLLEHPLPLRKRSLRSSIGQMIQKRGIRMPRRSMRLKRQVDVEDLLNLFGNERYFNEESQVTPHSFSGRARTVAKRHVPGRYSGYPETTDFRYPYVFQHRDDGILSSDNEEDDNNMDNNMDDLLLLPPNSRYIETPQEMDLMPYRTREEENEGIQKWLSRHTIPSVFRVQRRSSPFFYPIDYRYIPGYKKRSAGVSSSPYSDEEPEAEFGKWGHVVQVPEAYASPEDIARLYGLANLLSEGDDVRKRRSV